MDIRTQIIEKINSIVASPANHLKLLDRPAFDLPLIGFGSGADPLLDFYRQDIGPFYRLPDEWLAAKYHRDFSREEITLISWALPQTAQTRQENEAQTDRPALPWSLNRTYGEEFQREILAKGMEAWLDSLGIPAVAPMASPDFRWEQSEKYGLASNWSERHTAFLCGLGTFGLCDGLITARGKAMRFGSVIAAVRIAPDQRPYTRYNEYCLADEGCTACIDRCPAHAITAEGGHNKTLCRQFQQEQVFPWCREHYGFEGTYGCGLCQTCTPCEYGIPKRTSKNG